MGFNNFDGTVAEQEIGYKPEWTMEMQLKLADLNIYTGDLDGIFGFQTKLHTCQIFRSHPGT